MILGGGAALDWGSKLAKVRMSSAESEVGAGSLASKRYVYVRSMVGEVIPLPRTASAHMVDNSAQPALTENLGVSKKTEHFRRWLHCMRHLVLSGFTYVHLIRTHEMHADALTKVVSRFIFYAFRRVFFGSPP